MISIIAREGEKEWIFLDLGEFFSIILMASGTRSWPVPGSKPTRYSKYLFYRTAELVSLGHQSSVWGPGAVSGRGAILTGDHTGESLESRERVSKHVNSMCQCGEAALKPRWWHQGYWSPAWDQGPNKDRKPGWGSRLSWDTPSFLSGWCLCPIELSRSNGTIKEEMVPVVLIWVLGLASWKGSPRICSALTPTCWLLLPWVLRSLSWWFSSW